MKSPLPEKALICTETELDILATYAGIEKKLITAPHNRQSDDNENHEKTQLVKKGLLVKNTENNLAPSAQLANMFATIHHAHTVFLGIITYKNTPEDCHIVYHSKDSFLYQFIRGAKLHYFEELSDVSTILTYIRQGLGVEHDIKKEAYTTGSMTHLNLEQYETFQTALSINTAHAREYLVQQKLEQKFIDALTFPLREATLQVEEYSSKNMTRTIIDIYNTAQGLFVGYHNEEQDVVEFTYETPSSLSNFIISVLNTSIKAPTHEQQAEVTPPLTHISIQPSVVNREDIQEILQDYFTISLLLASKKTQNTEHQEQEEQKKKTYWHNYAVTLETFATLRLPLEETIDELRKAAWKYAEEAPPTRLPFPQKPIPLYPLFNQVITLNLEEQYNVKKNDLEQLIYFYGHILSTTTPHKENEDWYKHLGTRDAYRKILILLGQTQHILSMEQHYENSPLL